ncbi:hypothetical protein AB4Z18_12180 [Leifsonia sp. 2TAF2]|uniref:hypothetical protein n=1 Tax=Leifsonia sp. 2TAF2 TaxID=3233009 RepID=UPI003F9B4E72
MKHVTYADKSLLVGDEAADLLMSYATALGQTGGTDAVTLRAIGVDGNEVEATFLLSPAVVLMVETASTTATEPDNIGAVRYLRERVEALAEPFAPDLAGGHDAAEISDGHDTAEGDETEQE